MGELPVEVVLRGEAARGIKGRGSAGQGDVLEGGGVGQMAAEALQRQKSWCRAQWPAEIMARRVLQQEVARGGSAISCRAESREQSAERRRHSKKKGSKVNSQRRKKEGWGRLDQNVIFQNSRDLSVNKR
jgi:hypothetical protein